MIQKRDFNEESKDKADSKYAYSFDYDVLHHYMIESFKPFIQPNATALELGCYQGEFTKRLSKHFTQLTSVDASSNALEIAKKKLPEVEFIHSTFEDLELQNTFENIVMTHVLEHVQDPVMILERINKEWLSEGGRLLLVCPNANAPSRQIAVKMGLISHNSAVTDAERKHGHFCTYSLDTLERDAKAAGLKVIHRSGIFFKALANFQWDKLLTTDIISEEYLQGCFELGQVYPDLCASIFIVCEKG